MTARDHTAAVLGELERTLGAISPDAAEKLVDRIVGARKILVAGAGRSGLAVRGFAMRLMHMGFDAYPGYFIVSRRMVLMSFFGANEASAIEA